MICNIIEQFINYYILQFYFSYHALNCQGLVFDGCLTLSYHPCTFTQKQSSKNQKMTVRCNRFNKSIKINLQTNLYTFQVYNSPFMNYNSCETCIFKYFFVIHKLVEPVARRYDIFILNWYLLIFLLNSIIFSIKIELLTLRWKLLCLCYWISHFRCSLVD